MIDKRMQELRKKFQELRREKPMKVYDDQRWATYRRWAESSTIFSCVGMPKGMNPEQLVDSYRLAKNFVKELDKCE